MSTPQRNIVESMSIDIQLLAYFSKAYELKSFSRAADALFISRQALRYHIKTIEEQLDCELFIYQNNHLQPTQEGELLYQLSRETLHAYKKMQLSLVEHLVSKRRKLHCGQTAGSHELWDKDELNLRRKRYSELPYIFTTGTCDHLRQELRLGNLDSINIITDTPSDPEFDYYVSQSGVLYLMVNHNHSLATHKTVSIDDLRNQRFVTQGNGFDLHRVLDNLCYSKGFKLNVVYTGLDFFELAGQVSANVGISYSLFPYANHYDSTNIVYIPFETPIPWYVLVLKRKS